jgi:type IV pilus assembly protein PilA
LWGGTLWVPPHNRVSTRPGHQVGGLGCRRLIDKKEVRTMDEKDKRCEGGFTLIELLVVVIIIGILAAIAIPTLISQRQKAWQSATKSDLHNAAIAAEMYYDGNLTYAGVSPGEFRFSDDVSITVASASPNSYCLNADHASLAPAVDFHLDSTDGSVAAGSC